MDQTTIVVEALVATDPEDMSLRDDRWELALDQQAFGPGRILVAAGDRAGHLLAIAYTTKTDPPESALACCLEHLFGLAIVPAAAVVFNDEPVKMAPPPSDLELRFRSAQECVAQFGVHLVDWFACDALSELIRSTRLAIDPGSEWWDVP
jgi:hypothetical protein